MAEQLKPGDLVYYYPVRSRRPHYKAVVDSEPWKLGGVPVINLRDLEPAYADDVRPGATTVRAAALDCVVRRTDAAAEPKNAAELALDAIAELCQLVRDVQALAQERDDLRQTSDLRGEILAELRAERDQLRAELDSYHKRVGDLEDIVYNPGALGSPVGRSERVLRAQPIRYCIERRLVRGPRQGEWELEWIGAGRDRFRFYLAAAVARWGEARVTIGLVDLRTGRWLRSRQWEEHAL